MADPKITLEQVLRVAKLARLKLSPKEAEAMRVELDSILGHIAQLDALDVTDVPPTFHSIPMDAPFRTDVEARCVDRAEALAEAPETDGEGFAVPIVLEVDS